MSYYGAYLRQKLSVPCGDTVASHRRWLAMIEPEQQFLTNPFLRLCTRHGKGFLEKFFGIKHRAFYSRANFPTKPQQLHLIPKEHRILRV